MGECNGEPNPHEYPVIPANLLKNNRKEKTMQYTAMLLSLSLLVSAGAFAAEHWPPKQTKRRKRSFGLDLRVLPMGLPNFLPVMSVSTVCFLSMIRRILPVRMSPLSQGPDPLGTRTRQGST